MKCYACEKEGVREDKAPFVMYGEEIGSFDALICDKCGEILFTEEASDLIDEITKQKGLWGLEANTKVGQVGNAVDVKISKRLATFAGLKKGTKVRVYPETKKRIIIDLE